MSKSDKIHMKSFNILIALLFSLNSQAAESPQVIEQAKKLHISLTGTLPSKAELSATIALMKQGKKKEAAQSIIASDRNFIDLTVKGLVTPWTNQSSDNTQPLNDMSALMIGFVRDNIPFNQIFYQDAYYVFKGVFIGATLTAELRSMITGPGLRFLTEQHSQNSNEFPSWVPYDYTPTGVNDTDEKKYERLRANFPNSDKIIIKDPANPTFRYIISRYSRDRNDHYREANALGLSFSNPAIMTKVYQSDYLHPDERGVSGILSTREFGRSYLQAGTNRAAVAYTMQHFFCNWVDTLKDSALSDEFVRKDIPRAPGGIETTYKNNCVACHAGLDPLTNAFAYHDYASERIQYKFGSVVQKQNSNISNDDTEIGFRVTDDSWVNFWRNGLNSRLGWPTTPEGQGLPAFGQLLAGTKHFSSCMSKRVYEKVCLENIRSIGPDEKTIVEGLSQKFVKANYNMKDLFAETAISCKE